MYKRVKQEKRDIITNLTNKKTFLRRQFGRLNHIKGIPLLELCFM